MSKLWPTNTEFVVIAILMDNADIKELRITDADLVALKGTIKSVYDPASKAWIITRNKEDNNVIPIRRK